MLQKGRGITKDETGRSRLLNVLGLSSSAAILIFFPSPGFLSARLRAVFKCARRISLGEKRGNTAGFLKSKAAFVKKGMLKTITHPMSLYRCKMSHVKTYTTSRMDYLTKADASTHLPMTALTATSNYMVQYVARLRSNITQAYLNIA